MPAKSEIAWAAGLYEGEGNLGQQNYYKDRKGKRCVRHTPQFQLRVFMTDREPVEKFQQVFGGGLASPKLRRGYNRIMYGVTIWKLPEIQKAVIAMWPYLSSRRREQLSVVFLYGGD
jgi:hypothetical protein